MHTVKNEEKNNLLDYFDKEQILNWFKVSTTNMGMFQELNISNLLEKMTAKVETLDKNFENIRSVSLFDQHSHRKLSVEYDQNLEEVKSTLGYARIINCNF